jgi:hypothetical protein
MTNPKFIALLKMLPAFAIAATILFAGDALAAKPVSKKLQQQTSSSVTQAAVGDDVLIEGQVLEISMYQSKSGDTVYRFMISRPTIDGTPARSAYLTADSTEVSVPASIPLGSQISAYGTISSIIVKQYYSTYYLDATSDIQVMN